MLVTSACLAELGNQVLFFDLDTEKIKTLNEGNLPIYEPNLLEIVRKVTINFIRARHAIEGLKKHISLDPQARLVPRAI